MCPQWLLLFLVSFYGEACGKHFEFKKFFLTAMSQNIQV